MSDIVCTSCVIQVPEPHQVIKFYRKQGRKSVEMSPEDVFAEAHEVGLSMDVVVAYAEEGSKGHKALPGIEFKTVVEEVMVDKEKVFDGNEEQALKAGWVENEFGYVCPDCADTDAGSSESSGSLEDFITGLLPEDADGRSE